MNETIIQFDYPNTVIYEYNFWIVLVRPLQITLGSLILACKGEYSSLAEVPPEAYAELSKITSDIEVNLKTLFSYDKINYLLLMMRDKYVHFHVIPRYSKTIEFLEKEYDDKKWPMPPDITDSLFFSNEEFKSLIKYIRENWKINVYNFCF